MGSSASHLDKAKHNENFIMQLKKIDSFQKPVFPDWIVTAIFYSALHYVDSKLAVVAPPLFKHPSNHAERNTAVACYLPNISKYYFFLKNKSEYARYFPYSEKRIPSKTIITCLRYLAKIRQ